MIFSVRHNIIRKILIIITCFIQVFITIESGWKVGLLGFLLFGFIFLISYKSFKPVLSFSNFEKLYFILILLSFVSIIYSKNLTFFMDVFWKILSCFTFLQLLKVLIGFDHDLEFYFKIFLFFTLLLGSFNIYFHEPFSREMAYGGINPNGLIMFISIMFTFFMFFWKKRRFYFIFIPIYSYTLFLTASQKAQLSIIICFLIYVALLMYYKRIKHFFRVLFISLFLVGSLYFFISNNKYLSYSFNRTSATIQSIISGKLVEGSAGVTEETTRYILKARGIDYFIKSPFFGYGLNNMRELHIRDYGFNSYSHHTLLELGIGMGFLGILLFCLSFFFLVYSNFVNYKIRSNIIYLFIISLLLTCFNIGFYMQIYFDHFVFFVIFISLHFNKKFVS